MTREEIKEKQWRPIKGFEGRYIVSDCGEVDSILFNKRKRLKLRKKGGYVFVVLYNNGVCNQFAIHRLVADAFLGEHSELLNEINHKDENPFNNSVDNLEWCNRKYNMNYGTQKQRAIKTSRSRGLKSGGVPVIQINKNGERIMEFDSIYEASRITGIDATTIVKCCRKEKSRKCAGNYKWEYKYEQR